jgi:hypothetical protein
MDGIEKDLSMSWVIMRAETGRYECEAGTEICLLGRWMLKLHRRCAAANMYFRTHGISLLRYRHQASLDP